MANVIGQRIMRREDPRFLRGEGTYVENMEAADALHVTFVRSPYAHARIAGIDASPAEGVQILTAADLDIGPFPTIGWPGLDQSRPRPLLAADVVRYVRVIGPDVGGGFGAKGLSVEDVLVAWLARKTGRPVRWTETRSENMVAMHHARASILDFELGGSRDGVVEAYRLRVLADSGAYPGIGAILPFFTALMASGVYRIPRIEFDAAAVVTNTTPTGAFRGGGRPEGAPAIERAIDLFAAEVGLDPAELRRRNFVPPDAFPYTTASGATYDCGDYGGALDRALEAVGYEELRNEQARRNGTRRLGVGLSTYVEVTNGGPESEFGEVEVTASGEAILRTGSFSHGQGHETTCAMIVAERLGLPLESVQVIK